jgi:hypothetical protein
MEGNYRDQDNQHQPTPPLRNSGVYRHSSDAVRSDNAVGGEVPRSDYAGKDPVQKRDERPA